MDGRENSYKWEPVPIENTYVYLASTWATPELKIDGETIDCYLMEENMPSEWGNKPASVYWPDSALNILKGR